MRSLDLPSLPKLFADLLEQAPSALPFFPCIPTRNSLQSHADSIRSRSFHRQLLGEILAHHAERFRSGARSRANIQRLGRNEAAVILTELKPELFGGPLSSWLKCLTATKLADSLERDGIPAIPLVWVESLDAGFDEVGSVRCHDRQGRLQTLTLPARDPAGTGRGPSFLLPADVEDLISRLGEARPEMASDGAVLRLLESTYTPGTHHSVAFGRLLSALAEQWGLVLLDAQDPVLRHLGAPLLDDCLKSAEAIHRVAHEQSENLRKAGYDIADRLEPFAPILYFGEESTHILEFGSSGLGPWGRATSRNQLVENLVLQPERFYPSSWLRPVFRDRVLPTLTTIIGPEEAESFALALPFYGMMGQPPPLVCPRASFTLLDGRSRKTLERYNLTLIDMFKGSAQVVNELIRTRLETDTPSRFDGLAEAVGRRLSDLRTALPPEDASLEAVIDACRSKLIYQLGRLKERFMAGRVMREEAMRRHIERACDAIAPEGRLQEDQLAGVHFLLRFTRTLLVRLYAEINTSEPGHRVVSVE